QPLMLRADPRVIREGITQAVLDAQFAHNIRVRDLVSDANHVAELLRTARARLGASNAELRALESEFFTPPVRYSRPGLQAHITYLYSMNNGADQAVGRDA